MNSLTTFPERFLFEISRNISKLKLTNRNINIIKALTRLQIIFQEIQILISINDWTKANKLILKAENLVKVSKELLRFIPELKKFSAWIHITKSEFSEAESELNHGLIIAKSFKNKQAMTDLLIHYGNCNFYQSRYKQAVTFYKRAKHYQEIVSHENPDNIDSKRALSAILNNLGIILLRNNHLEEALRYLSRSVEISRLINNQDHNFGVTLLNIADIHIQQKDFDSALEYISHSTQIFQRINNRLWEAETYYTKGTLFIAQKKFKLAESNIKQGIKLKQLVNHKTGLIKGYVILGNLYDAWKRISLAKKFYKRALKIAEELQDQYQINLLQTKLEKYLKDSKSTS